MTPDEFVALVQREIERYQKLRSETNDKPRFYRSSGRIGLIRSDWAYNEGQRDIETGISGASVEVILGGRDVGEMRPGRCKDVLTIGVDYPFHFDHRQFDIREDIARTKPRGVIRYNEFNGQVYAYLGFDLETEKLTVIRVGNRIEEEIPEVAKIHSRSLKEIVEIFIDGIYKSRGIKPMELLE